MSDLAVVSCFVVCFVGLMAAEWLDSVAPSIVTWLATVGLGGFVMLTFFAVVVRYVE